MVLRRLVALAATLFVALVARAALGQDPVRIAFGRCVPVAEPAEGTYPLIRYGDTPDLRRAVVEFGYVPLTSASAREEAVAATRRVEICWATRDAHGCPYSDAVDPDPADLDWLVHDQYLHPNLSASMLVPVPGGNLANATCLEDGRETDCSLRFNWASAMNKGAYLFVRVVRDAPGEVPPLTDDEVRRIVEEEGFCPVPYQLATDEEEHFRVYGVLPSVPDSLARFGANVDPCLDGSRANPAIISPDACTTAEVAEFVAAELELAAAYCAAEHSYGKASRDLEVHYGEPVERTKGTEQLEGKALLRAIIADGRWPRFREHYLQTRIRAASDALRWRLEQAARENRIVAMPSGVQPIPSSEQPLAA